jgi:thiamine pyrophosphate-dependent acetolactate synthase large subunit-like protein
MSKCVADLLIETLQAAEVERCYGIVGYTLNQIAHAIERSTIQWVHMRHEEAGAFAAGAEASSPAASPRAQARVAPAVSTSSMGSTKPIATARRSF